MRNNLKDPSRTPELLVLEPEINRLTISSIESKFNSNPNSNADWCFVRKIRESRFDCRVVRKKKNREKNKSFFFFEGLYSFWLLYFTRFYHINLISTLPSRSSFSGGLRLNYSGGFLPIYLFYDLIGNHIKTIPIWDSYLCKYFTIKKQLFLVKIVY